MDEQPTAPDTTHDAVDLLKIRLREELRSSMRAKDVLKVRALRGLIAALDDAQAIPTEEQHVRYVVRPFGDRSAEVVRLRLGETDVQQLLTKELALRTEAAQQLDQLGKPERAKELRSEAAVIALWIGR